MDDRMLDGGRVLWFIGDSPERAREALAAGHAWTPEQREQLERIASSAEGAPQPAEGPPVYEQASLPQPVQPYGTPGGVFAPDGADAGGHGTDREAEAGFGATQAQLRHRSSSAADGHADAAAAAGLPASAAAYRDADTGGPRGCRALERWFASRVGAAGGCCRCSRARAGGRCSGRALALARQDIGSPRRVRSGPCGRELHVIACR